MPDPITDKVFEGAFQLNMDLIKENMTRLLEIEQELKDYELTDIDLINIPLVDGMQTGETDEPDVVDDPDIALEPIDEDVEVKPEPEPEPEPIEETEPEITNEVIDFELLKVDESNYTEEEIEEETIPVYYMREYEIEETGEKVKVKIDANKAMTEIDDDISGLKAIKQAIKDYM